MRARPGRNTDWAHAHHGTNYTRLQQVKASYDPGHFFRFHQSIAPDH
jgi:FAD/FMN-containing dehydrogenase